VFAQTLACAAASPGMLQERQIDGCRPPQTHELASYSILPGLGGLI
jgi:hypothetical protein